MSNPTKKQIKMLREERAQLITDLGHLEFDRLQTAQTVSGLKKEIKRLLLIGDAEALQEIGLATENLQVHSADTSAKNRAKKAYYLEIERIDITLADMPEYIN